MTEAPDGTDAASAGVEAFCQAELEVEAAIASEDAEAIGPAFEALSAAAPDDIKDSVVAAIAEAVEFIAVEGAPTPEFDAAYGEVVEYMKGGCGFAEFDVEGADYSFTGLPTEVPAGPAIITFTNVGEEVHEIALARINDDVPESVAEILDLPEEEALSMVTPIGGAFAFPEVTTYAVTQLEPGRYVAVCFLPEGSTPEAMEQMMAEEGGGSEGTAPDGTGPDGTAPDGATPDGTAPGDGETGPPHFALGMVQEFTVT